MLPGKFPLRQQDLDFMLLGHQKCDLSTWNLEGAPENPSSRFKPCTSQRPRGCWDRPLRASNHGVETGRTPCHFFPPVLSARKIIHPRRICLSQTKTEKKLRDSSIFMMVFHERRMIGLSQPMFHASYSYRGHKHGTSTSASQADLASEHIYRRVTFSHDYMTTAKWIQSVASSNLMASLDTKLLHEPTLEIAGDATGMAFSNDFIFRHLKWKRDGFRPVFSGPRRYNSSLAVPAPGKKIKVPTFPS